MALQARVHTYHSASVGFFWQPTSQLMQSACTDKVQLYYIATGMSIVEVHAEICTLGTTWGQGD